MKLQLCLLLVLSGCSPKEPEARKAAPPKPAVKLDAVTLEGTAKNAKSGAVLETSDKTVRIKGLAAWPADVLGKNLKLKGDLQTVPPAPATMDPFGNAVQAILTTQYVLHNHSQVK
jgi:hypothetical protein